ncbi:MAG: hypothetical protein RLZZ142_1441 [Verrucomicrobiota bacterium]
MLTSKSCPQWGHDSTIAGEVSELMESRSRGSRRGGHTPLGTPVKPSGERTASRGDSRQVPLVDGLTSGAAGIYQIRSRVEFKKAEPAANPCFLLPSFDPGASEFLEEPKQEQEAQQDSEANGNEGAEAYGNHEVWGRAADGGVQIRAMGLASGGCPLQGDLPPLPRGGRGLGGFREGEASQEGFGGPVRIPISAGFLEQQKAAFSAGANSNQEGDWFEELQSRGVGDGWGGKEARLELGAQLEGAEKGGGRRLLLGGRAWEIGQSDGLGSGIFGTRNWAQFGACEKETGRRVQCAVRREQAVRESLRGRFGFECIQKPAVLWNVTAQEEQFGGGPWTAHLFRGDHDEEQKNQQMDGRGSSERGGEAEVHPRSGFPRKEEGGAGEGRGGGRSGHGLASFSGAKARATGKPFVRAR